MTDTLNKDEIKSLLNKLNIPPSGLVRRSENLYKETYADRAICEGDWLNILAENPVLIERPVVVHGNRAVIARPTEKIFDLIGVHTY
jgi:arsenate reductase